MVIAAFLNRRLLEPQKQRLMAQALEQGRKLGLEQGRKLGLEQGRKLGLEQGRKLGLEQGRKLGLEQGRKEERNNIREHLRQRGYNLDEMLPPPENDRK